MKAMTVEQAIHELNRLPGDALLVLRDPGKDHHHPVVAIGVVREPYFPASFENEAEGESRGFVEIV